MKKLIAGIILLPLLMGAVFITVTLPPAGGGDPIDGSPEIELACSALGVYDSAGNGFTDGNCVCSDPMATDEGGGFINNTHDFADSPDTSECMGNRTGVAAGFQTSGTDKHSMVAVTAWGDVGYALNQAANGGFIWLTGGQVNSGDLAISSDTRTICYRYYKQVDSDYSNAGTGSNCENGTQQRNKFFQSSFSGGGSGPTFSQSTEMALNDCPDVGSYLNFGTTIPIGPQAGAYAISPDYDFNHCKSAPCRVEYCIDGNISTGVDVTHRFRVYSMSEDATGTVVTPTTTMEGGPANPTTWGADVFHSGPSGDSQMGFFMEARWTTDNDDWIGCAVEVEGEGC